MLYWNTQTDSCGDWCDEWHLFAERSETPKSSPLISDEPQTSQLSVTTAGCDDQPSSPEVSTVLPPADSVASDTEEKNDVADVADTQAVASDAWHTWMLLSFTTLTTNHRQQNDKCIHWPASIQTNPPVMLMTGFPLTWKVRELGRSAKSPGILLVVRKIATYCQIVQPLL